MKLSNINEWLTLAANIGVLAGIFFLAIEVQQNTEMMQAQTRDSVTSKQIEFYLTPTQNEFTANILYEGRLERLEVDSPEQVAFTFMVIGMFRIWENEWYQYDKGLFEEQEFAARTNNWTQLLTAFPGYKAHWEMASNNYSAGFQDYLNSLLNQVSE